MACLNFVSRFAFSVANSLCKIPLKQHMKMKDADFCSLSFLVFSVKRRRIQTVMRWSHLVPSFAMYPNCHMPIVWIAISDWSLKDGSCSLI